MATRWLYVLALCVALAVVSGCSFLLPSEVKVKRQRKFMLVIEPLRLDTPESERPYAFEVEVGEFDVSRLFDVNQIVFRLSPEEIKVDEQHRWAVRPKVMITDAVEQYLKDAKLFTVITQDFQDSDPDYTLRGTVKAIERVDSGSLWYAHLDMTMQLVDRSNKVVWDRDFDREPQQVYQRDFSHTVVTLSQILRRNMEEAIEELDRTFLIRKLQEEGREFDHLQDMTNGARARVDTARADTADTPLAPIGYEIIPGKPTLEGR